VFAVPVVAFGGWAGLFAAGGEDSFACGPLADHVGGGGEWGFGWWWWWHVHAVADCGLYGFGEPCV